MSRTRFVSLVAVGALLGALLVPVAGAGAATAATLEPSGLETGFELDGDKVGGAPPATFDWDSFLTPPAPDGSYTFTPTGPYTTAEGLPSTGILDAAFSWDNGSLAGACPDTADATGAPGSQTPNTVPWAPGPANVNEKGDICSTGSAYEVVTDDQGRRHAILYAYWTRLVGNGSLSLLQSLEGPAAGRCDDILVVFDYESNLGTVTVHFRRWTPTANDACANPNGPGQWVDTGQPVDFAWSVGVRTEGPLPVGNQPQATFGEFAVDLTTAGLFDPSACSSFSVSTQISRTGSDFTAQTQDYLDAADPLTISNCGTLTVTKDVVPAGFASDDRFDYRVDRASAGIVLPDSGATEIVDDLGIDETDTFPNVLAATDYRLTEALTAPWAQQSIVCTTTRPGTAEPIVFELSTPTDPFTVYPDAQTDCVITNAISTVTVTKQTLPDGSPQEFSFDVGGNAATLTDGESATFAFAPGSTVDITEVVPDGWVGEPDITCSDPNSVINESDAFAEVTTVAGQDVSCTFTNTQLSTIVISKEAFGTPPNTEFAFTGTWTSGSPALPAGGGFSINAETGDGTNYTQTFTGVTPGQYSVTEPGGQHGTLLGSLICTIGGQDVVFDTATAAFDLAPGDTVTCYFVNASPGQIIVVKESDPFEYDEDFAFQFGPSGEEPTDTFTLNPLPGQATWVSPALEGGQYDISEDLGALPNWTLTDITCEVSDGGSSAIDLQTLTATVDLPPAGIAQCVFLNTADPVSLQLEKTATGIADGVPWSFDFLLTDIATGDVRTITLTSEAPSIEITDIAPGTEYSLTEVAQPGWTSALECDVVDTRTGEDGWQFTLEPGTSFVCTAENTAAPASVSVTKSVTGVTSDYEWSFPFALTPSEGVTPVGGAQSISGTGPGSQTATWTGLLAGETYTLTEQSAAGWVQGTLTCTGIDDSNADPAAVTFVAQPGVAVACAIQNVPEPIDITIAKTALGGDSTFQWVLTPIDPAGEAIVASVATEGGTGIATFTGLTPGGLYSLSEIDLPGWIEGELLCTVAHADGEITELDVTGFLVEPGDQISCDLENIAVGRIVVVKNVEGADGTFDFTGSWLDPENFSIETSDGTGSATFLDITPGEYEVTEWSPEGYDNTELLCADSDPEGGASTVEDLVGTIVLDPGEIVVCTFTNTQWGSIVVDKTTLPAGSPQEFDFEWGPDGAEFTLTDESDPYSTGLVAPGEYTVTETTVLERWMLDDVECVGSESDPLVEGSSVAVVVPLQATVYCTFVNAYLAPLEIAKSVASGPTAQSDGAYAISYSLTVTNPGALADTYDLDDELRFGAGITVVTATVASVDGLPVEPGWDGIEDTRVATAVTIDGGLTHTYEVRVTARVAANITTDQADCTTGSDAEGTGLLNAATIAFTDGDAAATACAPVPASLPPTGVTLTALWVGLVMLAGGGILFAIRRRRYPRAESAA
ncbi:hypothetical protein B1729_04400 [Microbacterium sp. B35-04]|uniref:MSCRAMM family protein n=1 Tax=Microbacterium sp. B35-04 TaxID=1961716 RepID=UPI0013D6F723|nr:hypothetical protein [Microbacterium sp. B35-04]KAF2414481.1 hypothetical protein B1729_04400 [Microbacterium sp. B35-04]